MAETNVTITARCDGDCGGDAQWNGTRLEPGGGTAYIVVCRNGCGVAPELAGTTANTGHEAGHNGVRTGDPLPANMTITEYWRRIIEYGRRIA